MRHGAHGFEGVVAGGGFGAEHDGVGAIEYGVGDVGDFGAGRHGVVNHAFHHLCGGDGEAAQAARDFDDAFLQGRDSGVADFDGKVATRHHHAIAGEHDFFEVVDGFDAFDFGDDAGQDFAAAFSLADELARELEVGSRFDEADGDVVGTDGDSGFEVLIVFFGECRRGQAAALFVDAFAGFEDGGVLYGGVDFGVDDFVDFEGEQAVIEQQDVTGFDVVRQFAVVEADAVVFAFAFVGGIKDEAVAAFEFHFAAFDEANTDFRALQVGDDGNFATGTF